MRRLLVVAVVVAWALAIAVLFAPVAGAGDRPPTTEPATTTVDASTTTTTAVPATTAPPSTTTTVPPDLLDCIAFTFREHAQALFEVSPERFAPGLDPDGNGLVCEDLPDENQVSIFIPSPVVPPSTTTTLATGSTPTTGVVETLPFTGTEHGPGISLAAAAVLAGGILLWLGRKADT